MALQCICKEMGKVDIPIYKNKKNIGILRLDNVLIVPNLDRRLFSVNSFLASGNNWVHFENNFIHFGIKDGPKIEIPFTSLPSNALIINNKKERKSGEDNKTNIKKLKLSTNLLHDRFHRSDGAMATIKAHDLWQDVHIIPDNESVCTSSKIMTNLAASKGKSRISSPTFPLEEI